MDMEPQDLPPLSSSDEQLLEELMTGTRSSNDPQVQARIVASAPLAKAYRQLCDAQELLDSSGPPPEEPQDHHRAGSRTAPDPEQPEDADQVREILTSEGLIATSGKRNWMALAAMCMVMLGAGLLALEAWTRSQSREPGGGPRVILSDQPIPYGPVQDFGEFHAPAQLQPGEQLLIHVYADGPEDATPLISGPLEEPVWQPSPAALEQMRTWSSIRWTYEILSTQRPPAPVDVFSRLDSSSR